MAEVTMVDGCAVHSDKPMSDESKAAVSSVISAAREKMAREILAEVLKADGYLYCAEKALTCADHKVSIRHAVAAILRATSIPK